MADTAYLPKTYKKDGGDTFVVAAGGKVVLEDYGTVTQATSITTGVTLNKLAGAITTVSQTVAAGAEADFVVSNSKVDATDLVGVCIKTHTSGGTFLASVAAVASVMSAALTLPLPPPASGSPGALGSDALTSHPRRRGW